MKYYELELNGRTIKLRLTSNDCMVIEQKYKKSIIEFIQDMSMTTVIILLKYMVRSSDKGFSDEGAGQLFDELIDAGYTLADIINDVILEGLIVSGFMKKEDKETAVKKETATK